MTKESIKVDFKKNPKLYEGIHLEIRLTGKQIRFYEVNIKERSEHCINRETVQWLIRHGSLPKLKILYRALKRDKSIFRS